MTPIKYVAGEATYRYPAAGDEPCPPATKCLILTNGGICVIGVWGDDAIAWAPLPKRNTMKENQINDYCRTNP